MATPTPDQAPVAGPPPTPVVPEPTPPAVPPPHQAPPVPSPPQEEVRVAPEPTAQPAPREILGTPLEQITDETIRNLTGELNARLWSTEKEGPLSRVGNKLKRILAGFLGIGMGRQAADKVSNVITAAKTVPFDGKDYFFPAAQSIQDLSLVATWEVGKNLVTKTAEAVAPVYLGTSFLGGTLQLANDALRVFGRKENYLQLLLRSFSGRMGWLEKSLFKNFALGNRMAIERVNEIGRLMEQGLASGALPFSQVEKLAFAVLDANARMTVLNLVSEKGRKNLTPDILAYDQKVKRAMVVLSRLIENLSPEDKIALQTNLTEKWPRMEKWNTFKMMILRAINTGFLKLGPLALVSSLATGLLNMARGTKEADTWLREQLGTIFGYAWKGVQTVGGAVGANIPDMPNLSNLWLRTVPAAGGG